jgi:hypothetical protein
VVVVVVVVVVGGGGGAVVVVVGGGCVVVVVVVGASVVVVVASVVMAAATGAGSTRGEAATGAGSAGDSGSITGLRLAAKDAAATRAERDAGRATVGLSTASGVGLSADTAAKPRTAIRTTMITPDADIWARGRTSNAPPSEIDRLAIGRNARRR